MYWRIATFPPDLKHFLFVCLFSIFSLHGTTKEEGPTQTPPGRLHPERHWQEELEAGENHRPRRLRTHLHRYGHTWPRVFSCTQTSSRLWLICFPLGCVSCLYWLSCCKSLNSAACHVFPSSLQCIMHVVPIAKLFSSGLLFRFNPEVSGLG